MCLSPDGILLSAEDKVNSGKNLLNWPECETRRDKLGRTWAVICTAMRVWEGTAASCRAAWHQMGSISKTQLRSLRRPSAEMLKRPPSPPHTHRAPSGALRRLLSFHLQLSSHPSKPVRPISLVPKRPTCGWGGTNLFTVIKNS